MLKNIIDGWALNTTIRYLPYRSVPMLLGQMEPFRRAHNYREQIWAIPEDLLIPIPARGQLNRQIRVTPNSILWGATFYAFSGPGGEDEPGFLPISPTGLSLQMTDDATGLQFGSEFINAYSLYPGITVPSPQDGQSVTPVLLTQPRMFIAPGLISVEIANINAVPAYCQLCLYCSEPCELRAVEGQCV